MKYNEIIGYLNLYIFGTQLRVDFWIIDNKRLTKGIHKKTFYKSGKALEASVDKNKSSNEIFDWILEQLNALQLEEIFKNRLLI